MTRTASLSAAGLDIAALMFNRHVDVNPPAAGGAGSVRVTARS